MSDTAIKILQQRWQEILNEKNAMVAKYDAQLNSLDRAIDELCGKKISEAKTEYDDDSPTYITGTEDGI